MLQYRVKKNGVKAGIVEWKGFDVGDFEAEIWMRCVGLPSGGYAIGRDVDTQATTWRDRGRKPGSYAPRPATAIEQFHARRQVRKKERCVDLGRPPSVTPCVRRGNPLQITRPNVRDWRYLIRQCLYPVVVSLYTTMLRAWQA